MLLHHGNRSAIRTPLPPPHATTSLFGVPVLTNSRPLTKPASRLSGPRCRSTSAPAGPNSEPRPLPVVCFLTGSQLWRFGGILARLAVI